jgi:hypothetical protein
MINDDDDENHYPFPLVRLPLPLLKYYANPLGHEAKEPIRLARIRH